MVRVLCYAVGIISWPISKVLDYVLGDEHTVSTPLSVITCHLVKQAQNSDSQATLQLGFIYHHSKHPPSPSSVNCVIFCDHHQHQHRHSHEHE